jgi:FlaA1/EpsC-like NDP-sugar epimerase
LKPKTELHAEHERVVLYGAGGRCQLFLKEHGFNSASNFDGQLIVGLIDDEPTLHFKWVYGHMVLGGLKDLPHLITQHRIAGIIITAGLNPESRSVVRELAVQHGIRLSEWSFQNKIVPPPVQP